MLALCGCGVTTHVRPVPAGTLQVEGAIGGPIIRAWGAPLPQTTVGLRYGMSPRWDAGLHLDVSTLVIQGIQGGVETNLLVLEQDRGWPALSLNGRGSAVVGPGGPPEFAVEFSPTLSWEVAPKWLVFASAAGHLGTHDLTSWAVAAGTRLNAGAFGAQAELRWYAIDSVPVSGQILSNLSWVTLFGQGAIGVVVGVDYLFGDPTTTEPR
jgi:hypothetical protein